MKCATLACPNDAFPGSVWCGACDRKAQYAPFARTLDDTTRSKFAVRLERATLAGWLEPREAIRLLRMLMHDVPRFLDELDAWTKRGIDLRDAEWDDPAICTTAPIARRTLAETRRQEER